MQRDIFGTSQFEDEALISSWINDGFIIVVQILEKSLQANGYEVVTTVDNNHIYTYIYDNGNLHSIINVRKLLYNIAAAGDGSFDKDLCNSLYTTSKIHRAVNERVAVVGAMFGDIPIEALCDTSKELSLRVRIIDII